MKMSLFKLFIIPILVYLLLFLPSVCYGCPEVFCNNTIKCQKNELCNTTLMKCYCTHGSIRTSNLLHCVHPGKECVYSSDCENKYCGLDELCHSCPTWYFYSTQNNSNHCDVRSGDVGIDSCRLRNGPITAVVIASLLMLVLFVCLCRCCNRRLREEQEERDLELKIEKNRDKERERDRQRRTGETLLMEAEADKIEELLSQHDIAGEGAQAWQKETLIGARRDNKRESMKRLTLLSSPSSPDSSDTFTITKDEKGGCRSVNHSF